MPKHFKTLYCLHLTSKKRQMYDTLFQEDATEQHFFPDLVFSPGRCCDANTQKSYSPIVRTIQENVKIRLPLSE